MSEWIALGTNFHYNWVVDVEQILSWFLYDQNIIYLAKKTMDFNNFLVNGTLKDCQEKLAYKNQLLASINASIICHEDLNAE